MGVTLSKVGLVMLGVADMPRALAFYRDKLGMKVQSENAEFAFLDGGGVTLALSTPLQKHTKLGAGAVEIVFSVESVRGAHEALRARGVEFIQEPRAVVGTMWSANFKDPDGHHLSIFGPEKKA
jgi:methylmalonyl-CoA/ethylmalonyl-CoA epimerase